MGWHYQDWWTRKALIADLVKIEERPTGWKRRPVANCYRGNAFSGVLWSVVELVDAKDVVQQRWIESNLLLYASRDKCWGYKPIPEEAGPNRYSCPLSYLAMVPEDDPLSDGVNPKWRAVVRQTAAAKRESRSASRRPQMSN